MGFVRVWAGGVCQSSGLRGACTGWVNLGRCGRGSSRCCDRGRGMDERSRGPGARMLASYVNIEAITFHITQRMPYLQSQNFEAQTRATIDLYSYHPPSPTHMRPSYSQAHREKANRPRRTFPSNIALPAKLRYALPDPLVDRYHKASRTPPQKGKVTTEGRRRSK